MDILMLGSFILFLLSVGVFTYFKTRKTNLESSEGFFLAGRSLSATVIMASLLMTNISAANFVGMSAQSYTHNMSVMGWEVVSGITLVLVAIFLMPRYLQQGITTIPEFVGNRYGESTRKFLAIFFLISLVVNGYPITLYAGALAMHQLFDIERTLGVSYEQGIWIMVWLIGIVSAIYAIAGGLRAVAVSDTIIGIVVVIGGLLVPLYAILHLGDGSLSAGFSHFLEATPEKFNGIGASSDPLPFSTLFTGLLLVNLYYWGTDQGIIQRGLAAKNLKEGQAGVIYAGFLKVLTPFFVVLPGIMAFQIFGGNIDNPDTVYPRLVNLVLPKPLTGFFAAAMFSVIMSSLNSILNSASTIFALDIYKPIWGRKADDKKVVNMGKFFGLFVAIISLFIAPMLMYSSDGLFQYLQKVAGFFNVPIFTIILVGYMTKRVPAIAAKIGISFFVVIYGITQLFWDTGLHFLHISAILFVLTTILMLLIGRIAPMKEDFIMPNARAVNIEPWVNRFRVGAGVIYSMIAMYVFFSPLGFAQAGGVNAITWLTLILVAGLTVIIVMLLEKRDRAKRSHLAREA